MCHNSFVFLLNCLWGFKTICSFDVCVKFNHVIFLSFIDENLSFSVFYAFLSCIVHLTSITIPLQSIVMISSLFKLYKKVRLSREER